MAFSRHLGVIGILSVSWLVAVGCDDDGDRNVAQGEGGEAGDGGDGPNGGKSTSGGSANNAGKGGSAAAGEGGTTTGGTAGSGGTETGGTAGSAASGGAGAGAVGGEDAGGASAGFGGASAGAGGDGGAGGTPEVPVAKKCDFGCNVDADCNGIDSVGHCDQTLKRCRATDCTVTADCAPVASLWLFTCSNDSECTPTVERCVAWQGVGYCAGLPDPNFPEFPCTFGSPTTLPLFGAAGEAEVCADVTQVCSAKGACEFGCGYLGCDAGTGDTCNPTTGLCECAQSTECTKAGVSVCGGNGLCGCADDTDCAKTAGATGLGKCVNGTCGCDNATACVNPGYANATAVCE
ncbi:MAG TPA: hypothetical protein VHP33_16165 [Polyangiaceae bacterium]|nr:hypothetical protein [Polyangiaceae bacterium]